MLRRFAVHPLLFAIYPVVFLFAQNLEEQVRVSNVYRPLLFVLAATTALFALIWVALRNVKKAALITTALVALFFSYGHIKPFLLPGDAGDPFLLVVWAALALAATVVTLRAKRDLGGITMGLNVLGVALVLMNVVPIFTYEFDRTTPASAAPRVDIDIKHDVPGPKRDIYYMIFDRYANEKVLTDLFDFDNSEFLSYLESQNFYVAHDSAANHQKTAHSVASSLNLTYLNYLSDMGVRPAGYGPIYDLLKDFKVARFLKKQGYRYHHIGSWWNPTEGDPSADVNHTYKALSEFSSVLLESTLWSSIRDEIDVEDTGIRATTPERVAFQVDRLVSVKDDPNPTFTFAHFLLPHPPYVFDRNGELVTPQQVRARGDRGSYIEQLIYTNRLIEHMVDELLAGPTQEDPIIIIQSDEGPHPPRFERNSDTFDWFEATGDELREKLLILNAYHFPGGHDDQLYQTISPVNTFRVLFNEYFGTDLPLLKDTVQVFQSRRNLYRFQDMTESVTGRKTATRQSRTDDESS